MRNARYSTMSALGVAAVVAVGAVFVGGRGSAISVFLLAGAMAVLAVLLVAGIVRFDASRDFAWGAALSAVELVLVGVWLVLRNGLLAVVLSLLWALVAARSYFRDSRRRG